MLGEKSMGIRLAWGSQSFDSFIVLVSCIRWGTSQASQANAKAVLEPVLPMVEKETAKRATEARLALRKIGFPRFPRIAVKNKFGINRRSKIEL